MTHFGIICPTSSGHLYPMTTLGHELKQRGHRVTVIGVVDAQEKALAAKLEFHPIAEAEVPLGSTAQALAKLGELRGKAALRYTVTLLASRATRILQNAPQACQQIGIDALLVDQVTPEGGTVAEFLDIPFVTVCNALMLNRDPSVPPFNTLWQYHPSSWSRLRNRLGYSLLNWVTKPIRQATAEYRQKWNLPPYSTPNAFYSQLAQVSQQPPEFEFPRANLPKTFHFAGPFHSQASRQSVPFSWEKLTDQPLIYASMGTLQNRLLKVFEAIAAACEGKDVQLVVSLGGSAHLESFPPLPGNPLVVEYAPQLELLQKAALTITHAGMNTTLESLANGVPMVAIPVTNDQPGVAARIAWTRTGEAVPLGRVSANRLQQAVDRVLTKDTYQQNALRLQEAIKRAGGVSRAADVVEQAVSTGRPVLA